MTTYQLRQAGFTVFGQRPQHGGTQALVRCACLRLKWVRVARLERMAAKQKPYTCIVCTAANNRPKPRSAAP